jgi:hypothetical protein
VSFPVGFGCFVLLNLGVGCHLLVIVLEVSVGHYVVVTDANLHNILTSFLLWRIWRRTLVRSSEVMLGHRLITENVPVHFSVLARSEVPGLLLGIIGSFLESLHLVLEVEHIVGLLVSERTILE